MKNKIGYALGGAICAVLLFVFVLLPQIEFVEAAAVPTKEFVQEPSKHCPGPCHVYNYCRNDGDEGEECCDQAAPVDEESCLYYCDG